MSVIQKKTEQPLVSVLVITYNSSDFIIETLESIKAQTYRNIELIVTDDCSKDNTIADSKIWINKNKNRFFDVKHISARKNTGIAANCNRGLNAANGEWIKIIAGDDTLTLDAIENFISFIRIRNDNKMFFIHSPMNYYNNEIKDQFFLHKVDQSNSIFNHKNINASQQFQLLLRGVNIGAPSTFYRKSMLIEVGSFDEEIPFEDWPIYLKLTHKGYKALYMPRATVNYRLTNLSFYNNKFNEKFIFNPFFIQEYLVFNKYIKHHLPKMEKYINVIEYRLKFLFSRLGLNEQNFFNRVINLPVIQFFNLHQKFINYQLEKKITREIN